MKKRLVLIICIILALSVVMAFLSSCADSNDENSGNESDGELSGAGGSEGGGDSGSGGDNQHVHTPSAEVKENFVDSTCEREGSYNAVIYCSVCSEKISVEAKVVEKKPHTPSEWITDDEATCKAEGVKHKECTVCGETLESGRIEKTEDHTPVTDARVEPTDTEEGLTEGSHCSRCGKVLVAQNPISAKLQGVDIKSASMTLSGTTLKRSVSNDTAVFSFIDDITVAKNATYLVARDIDCEDDIKSKTSTLSVGNNTFYILVENENSIRLYTVIIRRLDVYTVSFIENGGSEVEDIEIQEGSVMSAPAIVRPGYTFVSWDYDFTSPVMQNLTISASWTVNTNTPYRVEYYLENAAKNGYDISVDELEGTTDTTATAAQKSFDHFAFDSSKSVMSGKIEGNGSLVLKVYYTRNSYTVSTDRNNSKGGTVTSGGTYVYEENKTITLTATTNAGYTFLGWFEGEEKVCSTLTYTFTVDHTATYTAKWEANTKTPYKVEYYLENVDKNGYDLSVDELEGTTDTIATAAQKSFDHFTFDSSKSVMSGNIEGNGSLVLKVYYTRATYTVATSVSDARFGSVTEGGTYPYGTKITLTVSVKEGYTFLGYKLNGAVVCDSEVYSFTVDRDTVLVADITAGKATKYTVEYYHEQLDGTYAKIDSIELRGVTDTTATAEEKIFEHFTFNPSMSTMSGNIDGNGTLVLKVYYSRNTYTVSATRNNSKGGAVTSGGAYAYDKEITLTATTNAGYTFLGWFEGDVRVCSTLAYTFKIDHTATYTAKWEANTDTSYKVEYYLENANKTGYKLEYTDELEGTTDSIATAEKKTFTHFTFNSAKSVMTDNIAGNGSLVLKVYYTRNTYTVSTDRNNTKGGTVAGNGTYAYDKEITLTATTNAGYTFLGWFEGNTKVCNDLAYTFTVDRAVTYTAKWEANTNTKYTVKYYLQNVAKNGYDLVYTDVLEGTTDTTATAVKKTLEHFTFASGNSSNVLSGNIAGDGSLVLKVYYTRDTYTVSSDRNNTKGGTVTSGGTYSYDKEITLTATTNAGYTFLGWFEGDVRVCNTLAYTFKVDHTATYMAKWEANTDTPYRVEYYLENAAKNGYDVSVDELEGTTDTTATAAQKSFDHFTFDSSKSVVSGNIDGDGSLVLKVYYTRNSYTVSTDRNNSKGGNVTSGGTYAYEKEITLTATTNAGYTFLGWFEGEKKVCGTLTYTFEVDHTATYTAKWEANTNTPYRVEYYLENVDKNGYDVSADELEGTTDTTVTAAQKRFDHFTFDSSKSVVSGNIDGNGSLVLKVYYTRNTYTVSTDRNNDKGGNVTSGGTYVYEENKTITLTATTNAGYTFLGWFEGEEKVCSTLTYTFTVDHTATYTAKWEANTKTPYKVEYYLENVDKNGYDLSIDELEGTTDTTATATQKSFDHFTFDSSKSVMSGNIEGNGSLVLKVYYTRNVYTLSNANSSYGSVTNSGSYIYGSTVPFEVTAAVSKLGYEFIGWYSEGDLVCSDTTYTFTVEKNIEARFTLKSEMANFIFTSTATTCSITGIKDKTVTEIVVPNCVTSISCGSFYGCSSLESITLPFVGSSPDASDYAAHFGYIFNYRIYEGYYGQAGLYEDVDYYIPYSLKNVTITGESIKIRAFYNCRNLKSVTIGNGVTSIGKEAFYWCTSLESITIPFVGATKNESTHFGYLFGASSYYDNSSYVPSFLKTVVITGGSSIAAEAFYYCTNLTSITIPNSVITIGDYAFSGCTSLESVTIPNSVTAIGSSAFSGCTSLMSIFVEANNQNYASIDGNLYSNDGKILIQYAAGKSDTSFIIPDGVTTIGYSAFSRCTSFTSITIPDSVTTIGYSAFYGCTSLTSIAIPDSITSIDENAFYNCTRLTSVYITDIAKWCNISFGYDANPLSNGANLYLNNDLITDLVIPEGVTTIGNYAFSGCTSLKSVRIGNGVTSIGSSAFSGCTSLTSVTIGSGVTEIGYEAFYNCYKLVEVINKSYLNITAGSNNYGYVGAHALEVHSGESKIAKQGDYLFYTYNGEIYLVGYIGDGADISLPETYNGQNYCIYEYAFHACTSLVSVTIPDGVTSIGRGAFKDCSSLESITLPFVGASPDASGYEAHFGYIFGYSCQKFYEDPYDYNRPEFYHYSNYYSYEDEPGYWYGYYEYYTYYIPESLKTVTVTGDVPNEAFDNCENLEIIRLS